MKKGDPQIQVVKRSARQNQRQRKEPMCFEYSMTYTAGRDFIHMVVRNTLKAAKQRQLFTLKTKATKGYS